MKPEQDDFSDLRRLLTLKRYEQPPPGFFRDFSQQVIIRIRAGERIEHFSIWEALSWEAPWLQRIWSAVETRPIFAGGVGVAICGLLMAGMLYSEPQESALMPAADTLAMPSPGAHAALTAGPIADSTILPRANPAALPGIQGVSASPQNDSLFLQWKEKQQPQVDLINSTSPR